MTKTRIISSTNSKLVYGMIDTFKMTKNIINLEEIEEKCWAVKIKVTYED